MIAPSGETFTVAIVDDHVLMRIAIVNLPTIITASASRLRMGNSYWIRSTAWAYRILFFWI